MLHQNWGICNSIVPTNFFFPFIRSHKVFSHFFILSFSRKKNRNYSYFVNNGKINKSLIRGFEKIYKNVIKLFIQSNDYSLKIKDNKFSLLEMTIIAKKKEKSKKILMTYFAFVYRGRLVYVKNFFLRQLSISNVKISITEFIEKEFLEFFFVVSCL